MRNMRIEKEKLARKMLYDNRRVFITSNLQVSVFIRFADYFYQWIKIVSLHEQR